MNEIIDRLIERAERNQHDPWFKERLKVLTKWKRGI